LAISDMALSLLQVPQQNGSIHAARTNAGVGWFRLRRASRPTLIGFAACGPNNVVDR
jgi:hypothetical protein